MDGFVHFVTIALIVAYVCFAIWFIYKKGSSWGKTLGYSAAFTGGGLVIIPIISMAAYIIAYALLALLVGVVLIEMLSGL